MRASSRRDTIVDTNDIVHLVNFDAQVSKTWVQGMCGVYFFHVDIKTLRWASGHWKRWLATGRVPTCFGCLGCTNAR